MRADSDFDELVKELKVVVQEGLQVLRNVSLPALARRTEEMSGTADAAAMEEALRRAVVRLGAGPAGEAGGLLLGLVPETRGLRLPARRRQAAGVYGIQPGSFRKEPQANLLKEIAAELEKLVRDMQLGRARGELEDGAAVDPELALVWLERFQAYFRIGASLSGLRNDLVAAWTTRLTQDRRFDEPEQQARGYASFALYHFARFLYEHEQFRVRFGGVWLLSTGDVEERVSDAIYRIGWHSPFNERDDSWLRHNLSAVTDLESGAFLRLMEDDVVGSEIQADWQAWVASCDCTRADSYGACPVHQVIEQADFYGRLIDQEWHRVAAWFRATNDVVAPKPEELYARFIGDSRERSSD